MGWVRFTSVRSASPPASVAVRDTPASAPTVAAAAAPSITASTERPRASWARSAVSATAPGGAVTTDSWTALPPSRSVASGRRAMISGARSRVVGKARRR